MHCSWCYAIYIVYLPMCFCLWQLTCLVLPREHYSLLNPMSIWNADRTRDTFAVVEKILQLEPLEVCFFLNTILLFASSAHIPNCHESNYLIKLKIIFNSLVETFWMLLKYQRSFYFYISPPLEYYCIKRRSINFVLLKLRMRVFPCSCWIIDLHLLKGKLWEKLWLTCSRWIIELQ